MKDPFLYLTTCGANKPGHVPRTKCFLWT